MGVQLGRGRSRRANGDINVTPFVDVVLVLLIIFMVVMPAMQRFLWLHIPPESADQVEPPNQQPPIVETVNA
ncbi:MAG: biopolymer transporter ExbD, partial [Candidatus Eremiobacteraeota bacterium]|nr:biopolymer transporter ExbD [Candidatus Eremiobacteraeota bacterium]